MCGVWLYTYLYVHNRIQILQVSFLILYIYDLFESYKFSIISIYYSCNTRKEKEEKGNRKQKWKGEVELQKEEEER